MTLIFISTTLPAIEIFKFSLVMGTLFPAWWSNKKKSASTAIMAYKRKNKTIRRCYILFLTKRNSLSCPLPLRLHRGPEHRCPFLVLIRESQVILVSQQKEIFWNNHGNNRQITQHWTLFRTISLPMSKTKKKTKKQQQQQRGNNKINTANQDGMSRLEHNNIVKAAGESFSAPVARLKSFSGYTFKRDGRGTTEDRSTCPPRTCLRSVAVVLPMIPHLLAYQDEKSFPLWESWFFWL